MNVAVAAHMKLCLESMVPLLYYDTVKQKYTRKIIVYGLIYFPNKVNVIMDKHTYWNLVMVSACNATQSRPSYLKNLQNMIKG